MARESWVSRKKTEKNSNTDKKKCKNLWEIPPYRQDLITVTITDSAMLRCWSSNKWTCINQCPWHVSLLLLIYLYMTFLKKLWLFRKKLLRVCLHVTFFFNFPTASLRYSGQYLLEIVLLNGSEWRKNHHIQALSDRNSITYWNWDKDMHISSHISITSIAFRVIQYTWK